MTKAQKALIKKRKRCKYCRKLIKAVHMRWMGDVSGCTISWECECNRLPWPAHMDREWFAIHMPCFCCGTVKITASPNKSKKLIDFKKMFKDCEWHTGGTPAISWAPSERI